MLDKWDERPQDVSNLLNPAFLGLLLHKSVKGFKREADTGMPFELVSLIPSIRLASGHSQSPPGKDYDDLANMAPAQSRPARGPSQTYS